MHIINLHDKNLYYIGGVVRDEILAKPSFDVDLTYVGNAIEYAKTIPNAEILKINEPFGTVKILFEGKEIDIASTRSEIYPQKGHLPVVQEVGCCLEKDILRRDFSINSLAKSTLTGEIIDCTNGLKDIKNKLLRVLHEESFIDDPTRIVRALKFRVRFGFELEMQTSKLQETYLNNINYDMSYKRLKKELEETFNLNSDKAFEIFLSEGIYKLVSKNGIEFPNTSIEQLVKQYNPECIWIIYVGLLPDISALPLTKIENKIVEDYLMIKDKNFETDIDIYNAFKNLNTESIIMYGAAKDLKPVKRYLDYLKNIKLEITGEDLKQLGLIPSVKFQEYFEKVLAAKFENPKMNKFDEINLIRSLI